MVPSKRSSKPFHIVGIGASAGGLSALEQFFDNMPADSGMAFVIVQHLSPSFKSKMDELLSRHTNMPIQEAANNTKLKPNCIYLNPSNNHITVKGGKLLLAEIAIGQHVDLPIDLFFKSLAKEVGPRSVGIILTGTGSDGSHGIQDIRRMGGLAIVQSPESAQFDAMPQNAIATGNVDAILSPSEIPELLLEHAINPIEGDREKLSNPWPQDERELAGIFSQLQRSYKVDFAKYKIGTIGRRIKRRMGILGISGLSDYSAILSADMDEIDNLYHDLLIGVTEFFRDEQAFKYLEATIIPELFSSLAPDHELRVWSAGCATGEEAYSLAILLAEKAKELNYSGKITLFATDVHKYSLESASQGIYDSKRLANMSPERLQRYFTEVEKDLYKVKSELRKMLVFALHDLTSDVPFLNIDLISCRNLLIYLRPESQKRVIAKFNFALKSDGILFLGKSEGVAPYTGEFDMLSSQFNLFKKIRDQKSLIDQDYIRVDDAHVIQPTAILPAQNRLASLDRQVMHDYDSLLEKHIPPGVLINENRQVLHYFGNIAEYLKSPKGRVDNDILRLADDNLHIALSNSLNKAKKTGTSIVTKNLRINPGAAEFLIDMTVDPLPFERSQVLHYHVYFERIRPAEQAPLPELRTTGDVNPVEFDTEYRQHVVELEKELQTLREDFQFTQENLQATIEELNATNEELQASNEELQSTNEELNSTNEELQSTNEELNSVSMEYERSNSELNLLNSDHVNLLNSIESGIVILDRQMCIRKYNPAIAGLFKLMPQDIGRPLDHIAYQLPNHEVMLNDVRKVLKDGIPIEKEVSTKAGEWLLKRIVPLRSDKGHLEGAIIMFTNISKVKEAELVSRLNEKLKKSNDALVKNRSKLKSQNDTLKIVNLTLKTETAERLRVAEELQQKELLLFQQNRMAAMGEMINNISHQWRQPLNSVGVLIQEIGLTHELGALSQEHLDANIAKAMDIVQHMSQTIDDFRNFFAPDKKKSSFKVDQIVNKAVHIVEDDFRNNRITIETSITADLDIYSYPNEFCQVIFNVLMNARDAFLERKVDQARVTLCSWKENGRTVITITDNAGGIIQENLDKIFDAYFTTKDLGKGTGIGLFMSRTIIEKNMGGRFTARNVGEGAEFRIEV